MMIITHFRNEVTTAMSRRSTPAWIAIRALHAVSMFYRRLHQTYGCKVFPTPKPVTMPYPICLPSPED